VGHEACHIDPVFLLASVLLHLFLFVLLVVTAA
jgi:hypothetical protein